jgi:hypothetical protein
LSPAKSPGADEFLDRIGNAELEGDYTEPRQPEPEPTRYLPEYKHKTGRAPTLAGAAPGEFFTSLANTHSKLGGRMAAFTAMSEGGGGGSPRYTQLKAEGLDERTARQIDDGLTRGRDRSP